MRNSDGKKQVCIRLHPHLIKKLKMKAARESTTMTAIIETLLEPVRKEGEK